MWRKIWRWLDQQLGGNALARVQHSIVQKQDEIAGVKKAQLDHILSLQREIDQVDTKIVGLRKEKLRLQAKCNGAIEINLARTDQLLAELNELKTDEASLLNSKPSETQTKDRSIDELQEPNQV